MKAARLLWDHESNKVFDEEVALREQFRDGETGVSIHRLTSLPTINTNIYPETPVSSPDGRRFIFQRIDPSSRRCTFWIADIDRLAIRQITDEEDASAPIYSPDGKSIYYFVGRAIKRMSPETFEREEIFRVPAKWGPVRCQLPSMAHRGLRFLMELRDPTGGRFGVMVVDAEKNSGKIVFEHKDLRNPHAQFSRNADCKILFQVNDGIESDPGGNCTRLVGENGASLHVIGVDGKNHMQLPVGFSPLERVQGHQCWVGKSNLVITTLHRRRNTSSPWIQDRIVTIQLGDDKYKVVGEGPGFTHIHTDPEGKYWVSDCNRTAKIYVGSVQTGRHREFCNSGALFGAAQYTHPHPFFLGDGKSIGWNSDAGGIPHIYFARIPQGFLEELD